MAATVLFAAQTTNATTPVQYWDGKGALWSVWGTFDSASVDLQYSPDGGTTWIIIASMTTAGFAPVAVPQAQIRAVIAGGGVSLNISSNMMNIASVGAAITSGGGGGGGATAAEINTALKGSPQPVSIADGNDIALGARADGPAASDVAVASLLSHTMRNNQHLTSLIDLFTASLAGGKLAVKLLDSANAQLDYVGIAHDAAAAALNPILQGGYASAAAPADVSADNDAVRAWFLRNGAHASQLVAAGALIGGDATNGLDVDITRMAALVAGSALIGRVKPEGEEYETVAASQSAQTLGATGGTGDYLSHVQVQPTSTTVGVVTILDNAIEVHAYPGGTVTAALYPFTIPVNAASVSGAWKITTGAGVKCTAYGNFT